MGATGEWFAQPVNNLRGRTLPETGWPAGYGALIERYRLKVPLPPRLAAVSKSHHPSSSEEWIVLPVRRRPADTLGDHLEFALKREGVDLSVLHALFQVVEPEDLEEFVRATPTGKYTRRIWFLYEWLTGERLDLPDAGKVRAVPAVDPELQVTLAEGELSSRHRVVDNLPGTPEFCPMVRWTPALRRHAALAWDERAREVLGRTHPDVISRAAAFLLLSDSRSSFQIEGERPPLDRVKRWGRAIGEAGGVELSVTELERLQRVVIGGSRFVTIGLREEGGFLGERDRHTREPIPEHISARSGDLPDLMRGVIEYEKRALEGMVEPVIAGAVMAFGFVYIHPFEDGNGRIHRWLIHHVLSRAGYSPDGFVFPVSAAILRNVSSYEEVLQSYSSPALDLIRWEPTESGNVRVLNETAHLYRYFDATAHAEFLYDCVEETVEKDLPEEIAYLEAFDEFSERVQRLLGDMPHGTVDLLHRFLTQEGGRLSKRARENEFSMLTEEEGDAVEELWRECHERNE
jgi:hypothetical protein